MFAPVACASGEAGREPAVSVDTSGSYPVARIAGDAERWEAQLVATIGGDSTANVTFGSIRSVLLRNDGSLVVVDDGLRQVSVFDSLGALQARWGRRGSGPGEFREPYSVAAIGDSVALLDPFSSRITLLDPTGRWLREWVVPNYSGPQVVRLYRGSGREFWNRTVSRSLGGVWVRYRANGPVDTMAVHQPAKSPWRGVTCRVPNGGISSYPQPWGTEAFVVPVDSAMQAVATSTESRIALVGRAGDTLRVIDRPVAAAPVTDHEWSSAMTEFQAWKRRVRAECLSESFERPQTKPVLNWLVMDDVGQLWVEWLSEDGRSFEVFVTDGRLRATVRGLPSASGIDPSIVGDRMALVVPDDDDVPRVQVYRIRRK